MKRKAIIERVRDSAETADNGEGIRLKGLSKDVRRAMLSGATRQ